jgi:splicing factor 3A subunit 3
MGRHSAALRGIYEDADGSRKRELVALSGGGKTDTQFREFNTKLSDIKDYYRKFPPEDMIKPEDCDGGDKETYQVPEEPVWSGEEFWGRYLDLHASHDAWLNLPDNNAMDEEPLTYADYVDAFEKLGNIPVGKKTGWGPKYLAYVKAMRIYLSSFASRSNPLLETMEPWETKWAEFDEAWAAGTVPGWGKASASTAGDEGGVDLQQFESAKALKESVGPDALKQELTQLGLKVCSPRGCLLGYIGNSRHPSLTRLAPGQCGGSPAQRAERLFMTKGKALSELPLSVFAGAKTGKRKRGKANDEPPATGLSQGELTKQIAWEEVQIASVTAVLEVRHVRLVMRVDLPSAC